MSPFCACPFFIYLTLPPAVAGDKSSKSTPDGTSGINTRGHYVVFDGNFISTFIRNNGSFNRNPLDGNAGFEWPKGSGKTANYASGIWLGGKIGGDLRLATAAYEYEFDAGPIRAGVDPLDPMWRVYKIKRGDLCSSPDYAEWPHHEGAPYYVSTNGDTLPRLIGDMTAWTVFNDNDPLVHSNWATQPLGVEVQLTAYAFNRTLHLGNSLFYSWRLYNKGGNTIDSMYFTIWSDVDLGYIGDDLAGCDPPLELGYVYNDGPDQIYGIDPPATGFTLLQGPLVPGAPTDIARFPDGRIIPGKKLLTMSAFVRYPESPYPHFPREHEVFNLQQGLNRNGSQILDNRGQPTTFMFPGDPTMTLDSSNWIEPPGSGGDRRFMMSVGPFEMNPGDTQEIVAANVIARGSSSDSSVITLKNATVLARVAYDYYMSMTPEEFRCGELPRTPVAFQLHQNYPNPFNPQTTIRFGIPIQEKVTLRVFDILGREVATLVDQELDEGEHVIRWDGLSVGDVPASSGVYFYRLEFRAHSITRKMVLMR